jgi:large subunit ribosomal protein L17
MHRHGYQGRKLQRAAGPRKALIRGQITSLILHEGITTTEAKAKEVAPYFERLVTKAKLGNLTGEREVRKVVMTEGAAQKIIHELAPMWAERHGGYTRIVKLPNRRGDNAPMAHLSLVMDKPAVTPETEQKAPAAKKATPVAKKPAAKKTTTKKTAEVAS